MRETIYTRAPSSAAHFRMGNAKPFYTPAIPKRPIGSFSRTALSGGASLGDGGVNIDTTTVIAALAGGVAVLSSKSLPDPGNMIAKVLGFGALGFAVYRAFFEGSVDAAADKNAPGNPVPGQPIDIAQNSAFAKISGAFLSPTAAQKIGPGFLRTTYPVRIVLSNNSNDKVSFFYQIISIEDPEYMRLIDKSYDARVEGQVAQSFITLKPKEQRTIDLRVDVVTTGTVVTNRIDVELSLQKRQSAESPWQELSTVTFEYARSN